MLQQCFTTRSVTFAVASVPLEPKTWNDCVHRCFWSGPRQKHDAFAKESRHFFAPKANLQSSAGTALEAGPSVLTSAAGMVGGGSLACNSSARSAASAPSE